MADMATLLAIAICRVQSTGIGRSIVIISRERLMEAALMYAAATFTHVPPTMCLSQRYANGWHRKKVRTTTPSQ